MINDSVAESVVNGSLPNYLAVNNINYLIDYEFMFTDKTMRMRGGYEESKFLLCLNKFDTYESIKKWQNTSVVLMGFNKFCYEN